MNWLTKAIIFGEKIKKVLKKRPSKQELADSKWISCCGTGPQLKSTIFNKEQLNTCPNCNKHYPFTPRERFDHFFGKNNYEIVKTPELAENPLNFPGYKEKLERGRKITGHHCAVMVAQGVKNGIKVTSFAIDSRFNGGSINASAGEAIVYCFQKAIDDLTPVVAWSEGGGQAMQESNIALHYMVKTVLAANTFKDSTKLPFINIYTNKC